MVKRYDLVSGYENYMDVRNDGDYVLASVYDALKAERDLLEDGVAAVARGLRGLADTMEKHGPFKDDFLRVRAFADRLDPGKDGEG